MVPLYCTELAETHGQPVEVLQFVTQTDQAANKVEADL